MGVLNQPPNMVKMISDLDDRIRALENSRRLTVPVVSDYSKYPPFPQSGDLMVDASTGYLYVFIVLVGANYNGITSASSFTVGTGSKTFTVSNSGAYRAGHTVRVFQTGSTTNFMQGNITAVTTNVSITVNVDSVGGSGTYSSWTFRPYGSWRQVATIADLVAANIFVSTSSGGSANVSLASVGSGGVGANATTNVGGNGTIASAGYLPINVQ